MQESFGAYIPFVEHLGFEMEFFEDGQSELRYLPEESHLNSFNVTHGGALMTLLDVTMATAANQSGRDKCGLAKIFLSWYRHRHKVQIASGQAGQVNHKSKRAMAWISNK